MKKVVIQTGGKQYLVAEGDTVEVELLKTDKNTINFEPLIVIEDKKISIGNPTVKGVGVKATIVEQDKQQDKITSIRYKPKKRVKKVRGHRQRMTLLKIDSIKTATKQKA